MLGIHKSRAASNFFCISTLSAEGLSPRDESSWALPFWWQANCVTPCKVIVFEYVSHDLREHSKAKKGRKIRPVTLLYFLSSKNTGKTFYTEKKTRISLGGVEPQLTLTLYKPFILTNSFSLRLWYGPMYLNLWIICTRVYILPLLSFWFFHYYTQLIVSLEISLL